MRVLIHEQAQVARRADQIAEVVTEQTQLRPPVIAIAVGSTIRQVSRQQLCQTAEGLDAGNIALAEPSRLHRPRTAQFVELPFVQPAFICVCGRRLIDAQRQIVRSQTPATPCG